jgi:hypothetical protein
LLEPQNIFLKYNFNFSDFLFLFSILFHFDSKPYINSTLQFNLSSSLVMHSIRFYCVRLYLLFFLVWKSNEMSYFQNQSHAELKRMCKFTAVHYSKFNLMHKLEKKLCVGGRICFIIFKLFITTRKTNKTNETNEKMRFRFFGIDFCMQEK